jgi:hypothetical protein
MAHIERMIELRPGPHPVDAADLARFLSIASDCALSCRVCAWSSLESPAVTDLVDCIELATDCAAACDAAVAAVLRWSPGTDPRRDHAVAFVDACALVCAACAEECERRCDEEHCRVCAQACRRCERECLTLAEAILG